MDSTLLWSSFSIESSLYLAIGPARLDTARARARHGLEDVGPAWHAVPPVPCRCGPRALPSAQARARGPKSVPGWPARHSQISRPCQPEARRFKTHQKNHVNKKYSNLKYFFPRRASNQNQNHTHREQEEIKRITELCAMLPH